MAVFIDNMRKQKTIYTNVKKSISSEILNLQNILEDLNDKNKFSGYDEIANVILDIEDLITGLQDTKSSLEIVIGKLDEEIKLNGSTALGESSN